MFQCSSNFLVYGGSVWEESSLAEPPALRTFSGAPPPPLENYWNIGTKTNKSTGCAGLSA